MKKSFKYELFISFFIIALITIVASGVFMTISIRQKLEYDYKKESLAQAERISETLENHFDITRTIMEKILEDSQIIRPIFESDSWVAKKAYNRLFELTNSQREYSSFYIYDENGNCVLATTEENVVRNRPVYWGLIKVAKTHPEEIIVKNAAYDLDGKDVSFLLAKAIVKEEECVGFVVATISDENVAAMLTDLYSIESELVILDRFWDEVYCSENAKESDISEMLHNRRFEGGRLDEERADFIFQIRHIPEYDFYIVIGKRTSFTQTLIRTMIAVILVTAAISLVLCFAVARVLSAKLMQPLNNMTHAMEKVRSGDLSVRMDSTRADEFGQLSRDFDDMTKALKVYVDLRSKQQQELSESNIAMMQAQLNPHFLYNTLDTIKWVAKANHIPELAVLSSSLAKILRASISPEIFVSLSKEMEFINNYIEIQKIRFPENFTFDAEVPIELEDAIVPKLILQPIVENAIVHGLKDRTNGHIFLNAYEQSGRLVIYVEDDGCGMDENMLSILNTRNNKELKGHIGFYNVDAIIRLHYGLNYGLHAENIAEGGVRITMELPLNLKLAGEEDM